MIRPIHWMLELLFPPKCVFCHKLLPLDSEPICDKCATELLYCEPTEHTGEFFSFCVAALPYEDPVRGSILRYKFSGRQEYAKAYVPLLAACIQQKMAGRFEVISWVPVSAKRKRTRGYDQAELLARATATLLRVPVQPTLKKLRNNPAQSSLESASARRANVLGVYQARCPDEFRGKRILLIDDVVTTSATLAECSRVLLTAGAKEVVCAALAAAGATKG